MHNSAVCNEVKITDINEAITNDLYATEKDIAINNLKTELDNFKLNAPTLIKEMAILFPNVANISIEKIEQYPNTDSMQLQSVMLYKSAQNVDEEKLSKWLKERLGTQNVIIIKQELERVSEQ